MSTSTGCSASTNHAVSPVAVDSQQEIQTDHTQAVAPKRQKFTAPAAVSKVPTWACAHCTFVNSSRKTVCQACWHAKKVRKPD
jgi:hypothetical protein